MPAFRTPSNTVVTAAVYAVLALLGLLTGVLGAFQHSWYIRPVPVSALVCVALLFGVSYGAGRAMRGRGTALAFTVGWALVTMVWIAGRPEGDLVIANDLSGYVYLYGGLVALVTGVMLSPQSDRSWLLTPHTFGSRADGPPAA
ncbi:hypothetical protein FHS43_004789 [Streptosporangium becharense]|uniref:Integral membrane protein n=1 Tax=Streptosporangium becharense TaxID=1816182 RepID=A0A7W9II57_9ACTN|nr:DUF6113 family protein [Streptosporangium becharense]MBB2913485.1 hypothetical protein [Streptosporangium becharense]MBB5821175.1 hypothetical protein [Streptosporangium becharense]